METGDLLERARVQVGQPPPDAPVVQDPHHNGYCQWCFDGQTLWHRASYAERWVRVRRISVTPHRVLTLARLISTAPSRAPTPEGE